MKRATVPKLACLDFGISYVFIPSLQKRGHNFVRLVPASEGDYDADCESEFVVEWDSTKLIFTGRHHEGQLLSIEMDTKSIQNFAWSYCEHRNHGDAACLTVAFHGWSNTFYVLNGAVRDAAIYADLVAQLSQLEDLPVPLEVWNSSEER